MSDQPIHRSTAEIARETGFDAVARTDLGSGGATTSALFTGPAGPARRHVHRTHDEVCVLLQGAGRIEVDGVTVEVAEGDVVVIPMGVPHSAEFDAPFRMLSVYGPTDDPEAPDREWVD